MAKTVNTIFRSASYLTRLAGWMEIRCRFLREQILAKEIPIAAWPR